MRYEISNEFLEDLKYLLEVDDSWHIARLAKIEPKPLKIIDWVDDNIQGPVKKFGKIWFFKDKNDWLLFTLRYCND